MNAVVFDMDGVMFDTERLAVKAWDWVGEQMGIGKVGYMVFVTMGRTTEKSVKIFKNKFGDKFVNEDFQRYYAEFVEKYYNEHGIPVKMGLFELLEYLKSKKFKIAVASSNSRDVVLQHLKDTNIEKYFDKIICGDMVSKSKPEPDIYLTACKELGENPRDCYAIEDSKTGLQSAHAAGCKVIMVPDLYEAEPEIEKLLFKKFDNLLLFKEYLEEV